MGVFNCFFKIKNEKNARVFTKISYKNNSNTSGKYPFIAYENTEKATVELFLAALSCNKQEDASAYISKNYIKDFDLKELSEFFSNIKNYKNLVKAEFEKSPKNCKTNSILVINPEKNTEIIHLHLIKEPDSFSNWKIYGIEKE